MDMTGWSLIEPRTGQRPEASARVTMAWRPSRGTGRERAQAHIAVGKVVVQRLGWAAKGRMALLASPDGRFLAVRPAAEGEPGYKLNTSNGTACLAVRLLWVESDRRPASSVEYDARGPLLLVTLPDWARKADALKPALPAIPLRDKPEAAPATKAKPGKPAPKPPATQPARSFPPGDVLGTLPPDELDEALSMMRGGKVGAKDLGDYFGWPRERAVEIAAALRDLIAAEARGAAA